MPISKLKVIDYHIEKYKKPVFLFLLCILLLGAFFFYSLKVTVTGKTVEHKAQVIGTTISHGHGPMTQVLHVKLNNGKELYVNNDGAIIKNGTKVLIIERYRNNNAASIYEFKNKI